MTNAHLGCTHFALFKHIQPTARRSAARANERVESMVGNGEFSSFMISGISVQPSTTASQPRSFMRPITRWKYFTASGLNTPQTSSSKMMRLISARS